MHLPRDEVHNVESLRSNWQHLVLKADKVQDKLMREERNIFEQELDKQIMVHVVCYFKIFQKYGRCFLVFLIESTDESCVFPNL